MSPKPSTPSIFWGASWAQDTDIPLKKLLVFCQNWYFPILIGAFFGAMVGYGTAVVKPKFYEAEFLFERKLDDISTIKDEEVNPSILQLFSEQEITSVFAKAFVEAMKKTPATAGKSIGPDFLQRYLGAKTEQPVADSQLDVQLLTAHILGNMTNDIRTGGPASPQSFAFRLDFSPNGFWRFFVRMQEREYIQPVALASAAALSATIDAYNLRREQFRVKARTKAVEVAEQRFSKASSDYSATMMEYEREHAALNVGLFSIESQLATIEKKSGRSLASPSLPLSERNAANLLFNLSESDDIGINKATQLIEYFQLQRIISKVSTLHANGILSQDQMEQDLKRLTQVAQTRAALADKYRLAPVAYVAAREILRRKLARSADVVNRAQFALPQIAFQEESGRPSFLGGSITERSSLLLNAIIGTNVGICSTLGLALAFQVFWRRTRRASSLAG